MTRVFDGDTIVVATDEDAGLEVRLQGINAPDKGECFYEQARDHMVDLVADRPVAFATSGVDQFGRALAHVWVGPEHVNLEMVAEGFAIATTPQEGDAHGADLLTAHRDAARRRVGLWGADVCGATGPIPRVMIEVVSPDPPGPDEDHLKDEVVTLLNEGDGRVDLSNWIIRDESSRHRYSFPPETVLEEGQRARVTSADPGWHPGGSPVWNNDGDVVLLLDEHGRVVDATRY